MGKVTAKITVTNEIDQLLAERGFISPEQIRSVTLDEVLIDTGATELCLPEDVIAQLGVPQAGEVEGNTASETRNFRLFKNVNLSIAGRERVMYSVELPQGKEPLIGYLPLEALGLEPDVENQRLRVLPNRGRQTYIRV